MRFFRKLAVSLFMGSVILGGTSVMSVQAYAYELNETQTENSDDISSEFSFASNSTLKSDAETEEITYENYYTTYGSAKASDTILEELYLNFDGKLTYALRDSARKSYSLREVYKQSLEEGNYFYGLFDDNGTDLFRMLDLYASRNTNSDGYVSIKESIIPTLKKIAKKLKTLTDEDLWPALCYYKPYDITGTANPYEGDTKLGDMKLVYGDENLKDEDAFVLLIMGDGFINAERDMLYDKAEEFSQYMMNTAPFSEFTDTIKIYAMGVDSNESGISNDTDQLGDVTDLTKDTYFGTGFWCGGMQRLVSVSALGLLRLNRIKRYLAPNADFAGLLVNSDRYGGSGGTYCTCSLNTSAREIFIHEMGHTIADLADEYYAGDSYFGTHPNMSNQKKVENLPWADFYGLPGIGKVAYVDDLTEEVITYGGTAWYKPCDKTCKMEILFNLNDDKTSTPVEFCAVCSEALRKAICRYSNVTKLFYQPYNRVFKDDGLAYKLSDPDTGFEYNILDYVFVRKGDMDVALSSLDSSLYSVVIKDSSGNAVIKPSAVGNYTVSVTFDGNVDFEEGSIEFSYEIQSFKKEKGFISIVDEALNETDYNKKYQLLNEALVAYNDVNPEDASVISAKESLDNAIEEFNALVDEMNTDSAASLSITSNIICYVSETLVLTGFLCFVIKSVLGGRF